MLFSFFLLCFMFMQPFVKFLLCSLIFAKFHLKRTTIFTNFHPWMDQREVELRHFGVFGLWWALSGLRVANCWCLIFLDVTTHLCSFIEVHLNYQSSLCACLCPKFHFTWLCPPFSVIKTRVHACFKVYLCPRTPHICVYAPIFKNIFKNLEFK